MRLMALGNLRIKLRAGITPLFMVIAPIRRPFHKNGLNGTGTSPNASSFEASKRKPFKTVF
jgi:hypothetical protein